MGQIFSNKKSRAPLVWIVRQNHQEQQTNLSINTSQLPPTTGYQQSLTKLFLTSEINNKQQQRKHRQKYSHQKRNSGSGVHSDLIIKNNPKMFSEKYIKDFNENTIKKYKLKNKMNKKNNIKANKNCINNNNNYNKRRHSFNYQNYNCKEVYNYNNNKNNFHNNNNNYIIKEFNIKSIHSEPCLNQYEDITLKIIKKQQLINNRKNYQYHFGYNIKNVEDFLSKCSLSSPGNIPVVLLTACILYQTQNINKQIEIYLPLGMVVNGMFKNQNWLYVKTPHAEEGYICYMACVPLGILPKAAKSSSLANLNTLEYEMDNFNDWNTSKSECGGAYNYNLNRNNKINRRKICHENLIDLLYIKTINKDY